MNIHSNMAPPDPRPRPLLDLLLILGRGVPHELVRLVRLQLLVAIGLALLDLGDLVVHSFFCSSTARHFFSTTSHFVRIKISIVTAHGEVASTTDILSG